MNRETAEATKNELIEKFKEMDNPPPFLKVDFGCLASEARTTVHITMSFEPREKWVNGIFHNSNYSLFSVEDGKIEMFSGWAGKVKFRKARYKTVVECFKKLEKYIREVQTTLGYI